MPSIALTRLGHLMARATNTTTTSNSTSTNSSSIAEYATALNGVNTGNDTIAKITLWWALGGLALFILAFRIWERGSKHYRHLAAMFLPSNQQTYWAMNQSNWWKVKKHFLYAALGKKRHNREIRLSSAINIGTLPSRMHATVLAVYILINLVYCLWLDYTKLDKYSVVAELRGRTGVLAVVNMIPLVIMAGRNNPLISILQISFDTYNLLHRWMGRIVVLEAVLHTMAWAYVKHAATGWSGVNHALKVDPFLGWGMIGTASMVAILLSSPSPLRHAFYETFLNAHIVLAQLAMVGIWWHCHLANLPQLPYITVIVLLWYCDRLVRLVRLAYFNYSGKLTQATIVAMPGDASRVTLNLPKYTDIKPGTHAYLRFCGVNFWESHPFSIAWIDQKVVYLPSTPLSPSTAKNLEAGYGAEQKQSIDRSKSTTSVSFIIHAQTGMTRKLYKKAKDCASHTLNINALFEGPYAGHHSLDSYGHCVLFAGSSGITHQLPYVKHLVKGFNDGIVCTRRIVLVWIIREPEHLEWVRPWMDDILAMPRRKEILTIKIFITRPMGPINSPSSHVQMSSGRPKLDQLMRSEVRSQIGAMAVTVCGPGALADNVREEVNNNQGEGVIDFIEESFTW